MTITVTEYSHIMTAQGDFGLRNGMRSLVTHDIRFLVLIVSFFIYAIFGSPTPDHPGIVEYVVGLMLILAIRPRALLQMFQLRARTSTWLRTAQMMMVYGLTLPLVVAFAKGHDVTSIIRDLIPFGFLFMPFLLVSPDASASKAHKMMPILICAALFIGLMFSLRVLLPAIMIQSSYESAHGFWLGDHMNDRLYLVNAPTVLFTALYFLGSAGQKLYMKARPSSSHSPVISFIRSRFSQYGKTAMLVAFSVVPLMAMAFIMQRVSIGITALSVIILIGVAFWRKPRKAVLLMGMLFLSGVFLAPYVNEIFMHMSHKHHLVGLNMRWEEMQAVIHAISGSWMTVLFGNGWGATFAAPSVGGVSVNFTHSLLTAFLLKTGCVGFILALVYFWFFLRKIWPMMFVRPVLALAVACPLMIDTLLYASYKSLDFGVILMLIALWQPDCVKVAKKRYL